MPGHEFKPAQVSSERASLLAMHLADAVANSCELTVVSHRACQSEYEAACLLRPSPHPPLFPAPHRPSMPLSLQSNVNRVIRTAHLDPGAVCLLLSSNMLPSDHNFC